MWAKFNKTATKTFNMLMNVYGDETASCTYIFKWQERLSDGQLDANNYLKSSEH